MLHMCVCSAFIYIHVGESVSLFAVLWLIPLCLFLGSFGLCARSHRCK